MAGILMDAYRYAPPLASQFAQATYGTNSVNPTLTDTSGRGLVFGFGINPVSASNVRAKTKLRASSTNYDIIMRCRISTTMFGLWHAGLCVTDGTKMVTFGYGTTVATGTFVPNGTGMLAGQWGLRVVKWTNNTSFSADVVSAAPAPQMEWLRIGVVSGDPKNFYVSENGTDWIQVASSSMTGFLTYSEVGPAAYIDETSVPSGLAPLSGTQQLFMSILYYKDPDIDPGF